MNVKNKFVSRQKSTFSPFTHIYQWLLPNRCGLWCGLCLMSTMARGQDDQIAMECVHWRYTTYRSLEGCDQRHWYKPCHVWYLCCICHDNVTLGKATHPSPDPEEDANYNKITCKLIYKWAAFVSENTDNTSGKKLISVTARWTDFWYSVVACIQFIWNTYSYLSWSNYMKFNVIVFMGSHLTALIYYCKEYIATHTHIYKEEVCGNKGKCVGTMGSV